MCCDIASLLWAQVDLSSFLSIYLSFSSVSSASFRRHEQVLGKLSMGSEQCRIGGGWDLLRHQRKKITLTFDDSATTISSKSCQYCSVDSTHEKRIVAHVWSMWCEGKRTIPIYNCFFGLYVLIPHFLILLTIWWFVIVNHAIVIIQIGGLSGRKGISIDENAVLDVHGKLYHPTWTRLASTLHPGDYYILLQVGGNDHQSMLLSVEGVFLLNRFFVFLPKDNVNWEVGQQIVIATSYHEDWDGPQNEVTPHSYDAGFIFLLGYCNTK